jgi:outer membrane lipoprotein-sorting protein
MMKNSRQMLVWKAVCVAALAAPAARPADDLAAVFARMDQAAPKFKGMRADMKKVSHTAVINEDSIDTGTIVVKVPKPHDYRMLMKFEQPDKKVVQVTGTTAKMYLPKANEVQVYDFGKGHKAEVEQFLKLGFGSNSKELTDAYTVTYGGPETAAGEKATRIVLLPKSQDVANMFQKFELWIADATGISVQQKMYEKGGNYSLATYPNMKLDSNIKDSEVNLVTPSGVAIRKM